MKDNGLMPYLESDKEAFSPPPTIHHVHGHGDQRSGHIPRTSPLHLLAYDIAQTAPSEGELANIMNAYGKLHAFNK